MKQLLTLSILFFSLTVFSQYTERHVDEFTKTSSIRSFYARLVGNGPLTTLQTRYRLHWNQQISHIFELKIRRGGLFFTISASQPLMFLMDDGSTVTFYNRQSEISCIGCGAIGLPGSDQLGITALYSMNKEDIKTLATKRVKNVRIYTDQGYVERKISSNHSHTLQLTFLEFFEQSVLIQQ